MTLQPYAPRGQVMFFSSKLGRNLGIDLGNENNVNLCGKGKIHSF